MSVDKADTRELDTQKLQAESLQLRNQQFTLGTIALAGSGFAVILTPAASALGGGSLPEPVLIVATASWLVLLLFLHAWSLDLRKLIGFISIYIQRIGTSSWERLYAEEDKRNGGLFPRQSLFVSIAFATYGFIVVLNVLASLYSQEQTLSRTGAAVTAVLFLAYFGRLYVQHMSKNAGEDLFGEILNRRLDSGSLKDRVDEPGAMLTSEGDEHAKPATQ